MQSRTILLSLLLLASGALDAALLQRRNRYIDETARLRDGMSAIERQRADAILASEEDQSGLMLELMRRQAAGDDALHLAIDTDSSTVLLERGGALLRRFSARVGPERRVGVPPDTQQVSVPRGTRRIEKLLGPTDAFELPAWLWIDRGLPVPTDRAVAGWVGPDAIVTSGGTLIYALPASGPLADSSYVMPGAIRAPAADLAAIRANLARGTTVYFF
jgi:hypothetical protein